MNLHILSSRASARDLGVGRIDRRASRPPRFLAALGMTVGLLATTASAQVVATTSRGVVVAHDGRIEIFDTDHRRLWSVEGVAQPSRIIVGDDRLAVIDSFANEVRLAGVQSGSGALLRTGETPIDGLFIGQDLFLLERDARALERIGADGARASLNLTADPAYLREANGLLYVYSRLDGIVQEISPRPFRVVRRVQIAPFASDFETDGRAGYLIFPRDAKIRTFDLKSMRGTGEIAAGAVPIDLAITRRSNAVSAPRLSIADPAAKRVWNIEGSQSMSAAVARGFIRGLLGLGLAGPRSAEFPTGIDRVLTSAIAYDSSTGTIYRIRGSRSEVLAKGVGAEAFAVSGRGVVIWQNGGLRMAG
jgi:hypothetical protein